MSAALLRIQGCGRTHPSGSLGLGTVTLSSWEWSSWWAAEWWEGHQLQKQDTCFGQVNSRWIQR